MFQKQSHRCYKCSGEGHIARDCPSKKYYAQNGRQMSCFLCWRKGHVRRECPQNKRTQNLIQMNEMKLNELPERYKIRELFSYLPHEFDTEEAERE